MIFKFARVVELADTLDLGSKYISFKILITIIEMIIVVIINQVKRGTNDHFIS